MDNTATTDFNQSDNDTAAHFNFTNENELYLEDPAEMLKPWLSNPLFYEISIIHAFTFIFGLVGNAMVIVVMAGDRRARSATNTFLVSLAVGDLLMLCVYGPLETYHHFFISWGEDGTECKVAYLAEFLSATSSVLNLLAVTVERFIVIVFPMQSRAVCTMQNMVKAVLTVWCSALLLSLPIVFTAGTFQITFKNNSTSLKLTYCDYSHNFRLIAIYQLLVVFVAPSILMTVCYTFVIRELWISTRKMQILTHGVRAPSTVKRTNGETSGSQKNYCVPSENLTMLHSNENRRRRHFQGIRSIFVKKSSSNSVVKNHDEANTARKQVIKMLILVIFLFFFCWGPRLTMEVLQKLGEIPHTPLVYNLRIIFNLMTFFHGCINPFIYCFMSKNFRARFYKLAHVCGIGSNHDAKSEMLLVPVASAREPGTGNRGTHTSGSRRSNAVSITACDTKNTELSVTVFSPESVI